MKYKFKPYKGVDGKWYWRLVAPNGLITGDGSAGYYSKGNVLRAIKEIVEDLRRK